MGAIIIKADKKSNKLISELARKLGGKVMSITDEQLEDLALGQMMEETRTGETASREDVMKALDDK